MTHGSFSEAERALIEKYVFELTPHILKQYIAQCPFAQAARTLILLVKIAGGASVLISTAALILSLVR